MKRRSASDATVSATIPSRRAAPTPNASNSTETISSAAASAAWPSTPASALQDDVGGRRSGQGGPRRLPVARDHQQALAHVLEPVGRQSRRQVGRLVVRRRDPDVRLATDRGEQDADLGQPPIERGRLARPARRLRRGSRRAPGSSGSWRSSASPRSRSSRPGIAWTSASCRSRRRSVSLSIGGVTLRALPKPTGPWQRRRPRNATASHASLPGGSHVPLATRPRDDRRPGPRRVRRRRHDRDRERRAAGTGRQRARVALPQHRTPERVPACARRPRRPAPSRPR